MKISYLVTCSTEEDTLRSLMEHILTHKSNNDEIVPLIDLTNGMLSTGILNEEFKGIFDTSHISNVKIETGVEEFSYKNTGNYRVYGHDLDNDYGAHKNYGISKCSGDWIMQLDGDEMLSENLCGESLHMLIESNPDVEAYAIPRINAFTGLKPHHATQWGWNLDISPKYNRLRVNWPDYQFRLFKNEYPRIQFKRKLHEKIEGYRTYSILPATEEYAIDHMKTIERQIQTNVTYNKLFSREDNEGYKLS